MEASPGSDDTKTPQAAEKPAPPGPIGHGRRILVQAIIWVTTLLAVVAIFAIWANRQVFNPDNWANTSSKLLEDPKIRAATANYLVDQLYQNVDVAKELRRRLPKNLRPVAQPLAGVLQNAAVDGGQPGAGQRQGPARLEAGQPRRRPDAALDRQRRQGRRAVQQRCRRARPQRDHQEHHRSPRPARRQQQAARERSPSADPQVRSDRSWSRTAARRSRASPWR